MRQRRGDRLPVRGGEPLPRAGRCSAVRRGLAATRACGPLRRRLARSLGGHARLRPAAGRRRTAAPVLSVFGGKITTYRRLAEQVMDKLRPTFRGSRAPGPRARRFRAATSRAAKTRAGRSSAATARCRFRSSRARSSATARSLPKCSATGLPASTTARASPSASCATSWSANGPAAPTTCCGAEARPVCTSTPGSRRGWPRRWGDEAARAARRASRPVRSSRHRRHAHHPRQARPRKPMARWSAAARRQESDSRDRPPGGMVRSPRADVAGRRGGRRERRILFLVRRRQAAKALHRRRVHARQAAARAAEAREIDSPAGPGRARSPPTSRTARPTSQSTIARMCRRCPRKPWNASSRSCAAPASTPR